MALTDFFSEIRKEDQKAPEYFLTLVIGRTWVQAGIWRVTDGNAQVVAVGNPSSWQDSQSLITAADDSLSAAAAVFKEEGAEPKKAVFGVLSSWASDGQIKKEELEKIKALSEKLELTPAGFVVIPEAITHYIKSQEGTPPNAILVGLGEGEIEVSLVRLGNVIGTKTVSRSVSLSDDVGEGLTRFAEKEPLPSRILIYDHKAAELDEAKQGLLKAEWQGFSFLHTPKVDTLPSDISVSAVSLAGATEIAKASGISPYKTEEEKAEEVKEEEVVEEKEEVEVTTVPAEQIGFGKEDVAREEIKEPEKEPVVPEVEARIEEPEVQVSKPAVAISFSFLTSFFENLAFFVRGRTVLAIVAVALLLALFGGGIAYWYLPQAVVTIYVAPKRLEKEFSLVVDPTLETINFGEKVIPGKIVQATVSGEKTRQTTGTKTVGERAKGEVTIRNNTANPVPLPAGTTLTDTEPTSGLKFTLDQSKTATAAAGIGIPGTVDGSVTAADIGAEYNLAGGTKFRVASYTLLEVDAISKANFSGGSSREVAAVSEEDQDALSDDLKEELIEKSLAELGAGLSENELLIQESTKTSTALSTFSHKVGEETGTLKLSMRLNVSMLAVSKNDINSLVLEELKNQIPEGFALKEEQIEVRYELEIEKRGRSTFKVFAVANLLPKINPDELAKNIAGKYPSVARDFLSSLPGFTRSEITLKPRLPGRLGTLPRIAKNIQIEVTAER